MDEILDSDAMLQHEEVKGRSFKSTVLSSKESKILNTSSTGRVRERVAASGDGQPDKSS